MSKGKDLPSTYSVSFYPFRLVNTAIFPTHAFKEPFRKSGSAVMLTILLN